MFTKEGKLVDRREMLRVKAKSLADEAKLIRFEERRSRGLRNELRLHRVGVVRYESRATYLAYGVVKGKQVEQIERPKEPRSEALWKKVRAMVEKYGPVDADRRAELLERCRN